MDITDAWFSESINRRFTVGHLDGI